MRRDGLEPPTTCSSDRRSTKLSYHHVKKPSRNWTVWRPIVCLQPFDSIFGCAFKNSFTEFHRECLSPKSTSSDLLPEVLARVYQIPRHSHSLLKSFALVKGLEPLAPWLVDCTRLELVIPSVVNERASTPVNALTTHHIYMVVSIIQSSALKPTELHQQFATVITQHIWKLKITLFQTVADFSLFLAIHNVNLLFQNWMSAFRETDAPTPMFWSRLVDSNYWLSALLWRRALTIWAKSRFHLTILWLSAN